MIPPPFPEFPYQTIELLVERSEFIFGHRTVLQSLAMHTRMGLKSTCGMYHDFVSAVSQRNVILKLLRQADGY